MLDGKTRLPGGPSVAPSPAGSGFAISDEPLIKKAGDPGNELPLEVSDLGELPRRYFPSPALFAIARDPQTIFAYWDIDWTSLFADESPVDQKIQIRLASDVATDNESISAEPLAGSCYIRSAKPNTVYRLEIGYYQPATEWHSVALSNSVTTPAADAADDGDFNIVSVPFHLHFQRLIDMFRGSKYDGAALAEMMSDLQHRADHEKAGNALTEAEHDLLHAIGWSLSPTEIRQRTDLRGNGTVTPSMQERLLQILGPGVSSLAGGFDGSSRSA